MVESFLFLVCVGLSVALYKQVNNLMNRLFK